MHGFIKLTGFTGTELIAVDQIASVKQRDKYRMSDGTEVKLVGENHPHIVTETVAEIEQYIESAYSFSLPADAQPEPLSHVST